MAFFNRILDFKQAFLARLRERRAHPRYLAGAAFPLRATLVLSGETGPAKKGRSADGLSWSGRVGNVSCAGLNVLLPPAALTARGETTSVRLTIDTHELEIPCTVAYFRVYHSHAACGVKLTFDDYEVQKAYSQIVEAVRVGTSFEPAAAAQAAGAQIRQQWRSTGRALLSEWRNATTRKVERFELVIGDHRLAGQVSPPILSITPRSAAAGTTVPDEVAAEVRDFFRWVSANLPKTVPADLRDVLSRLISSNQVAERSWSAPPLVR